MPCRTRHAFSYRRKETQRCSLTSFASGVTMFSWTLSSVRPPSLTWPSSLIRPAPSIRPPWSVQSSFSTTAFVDATAFVDTSSFVDRTAVHDRATTTTTKFGIGYRSRFSRGKPMARLRNLTGRHNDWPRTAQPVGTRHSSRRRWPLGHRYCSRRQKIGPTSTRVRTTRWHTTQHPHVLVAWTPDTAPECRRSGPTSTRETRRY